MYRYILKRIGMLIPVLLGVSFVIFALMHYAPGDPVRMLLGNSATGEQVEAMREAMGLNKPLVVQYLRLCAPSAGSTGLIPDQEIDPTCHN